MGFLDKLKGQRGSKWAIEKPIEAPVPKEPVKVRDLGTCIPDHAKDANEKKKAPKEEQGLFEKLQAQRAKEKEFKLQLSEKEKSFDSEELGIGGISASEQKESSFEAEVSEAMTDLEGGKEEDEIDVSIRKMDSFVPKFSSTARQKLGIATEKKAQVITATFEVSGVYPGAETMISGRVKIGTIRKPMSCNLGKGTLRVTDLKRGAMTVGELSSGESGTVFVRGTAGNIRNGQLLDFF